MIMNDYLIISDKVKEALKSNIPVVSLESTIISHGMPYPTNIEVALEAERIVTSYGAIPATIAIIDGKIKVGLSKEEIAFLGNPQNKVIKTSSRDLPYIVAKKLNGATTVAATVIISHMAGIKVFATGGIGGVHRHFQEVLDISNDLEVLSEYNIALVCAGIKSILDLENTLEYLETKGIPILGYKTDYLPSFYTSISPYKIPMRVDDVKEIATLTKIKWDLGIKGSIIIANPVPKEDEINGKVIDEVTNKALKEAKEKHISGKDITPFLLQRVAQETKGESLQANIKLFFNNCHLASQIAKALGEQK